MAETEPDTGRVPVDDDLDLLEDDLLDQGDDYDFYGEDDWDIYFESEDAS